MKIQILLLLTAISLSACSPQELFSNIAVSDVEKSAAESIEHSESLQEKLTLIDAKMKEFPSAVELGLVQSDLEAAAFAFRNDFTVDNKTIIHVEALMPDVPNGYYEVWLAGDGPEDQISIGVLEYLGPDNYSMVFESADNLSTYKTILITTETEADDTPEQRVMIGKFQ